ncbi:MAG: superoxide dismutase family protein [Chloroflexota bacterium]
MNLKKLLLSGIVISALGISAAVAQEATPDPLAPQMGATALLVDAAGGNTGIVTFSDRVDGKVVIVAQVLNLTPGFHGFHIHTTGACETGDPAFDSAGGHLDMAGVTHFDHAGDLPVLLVNADGTGELMVVTDRFTLADLLDQDGAAVMIHANADNYTNIPERYGQPDEETLTGGDSGDRVACGVIAQDAGMTAG